MVEQQLSDMTLSDQPSHGVTIMSMMRVMRIVVGGRRQGSRSRRMIAILTTTPIIIVVVVVAAILIPLFLCSSGRRGG